MCTKFVWQHLMGVCVFVHTCVFVYVCVCTRACVHVCVWLDLATVTLSLPKEQGSG